MIVFCFIHNFIAENLQWKMLTDEDYQRRPSKEEFILDSSYAFINNNPVSVQLISKRDIYKLKVNQ